MAHEDHRLRDAHRLRAQRGSVLVEFAICATLFIALIYGVVSYGVVYWVKGTITHAAEEGARAAVGAANPATAAQSEAERVVNESLPAGYAAHKVVTSAIVQCDPLDPSKGSCVKVTVTYPYSSYPVVPALAPVFLPDELKSSSYVQLQ